jgi:type I restriction enzyme R subunit
VSLAHQEKAFQEQIAHSLGAAGWLVSDNGSGYDVERALFPEDLLGWLQDSDPDNYARIVPPDADAVARERGERRILDRVVKQLATTESQGGGTLKTLRGKLRLPGARDFSLLQFPPADTRNPVLVERYRLNRLRVVPEVAYSAKHGGRLDFVLFANGIPVATIELKTEMTQALEAAKRQYRKDRRPQGEPLLTAGRGALVHFAVSEEQVAMTTRLAGDATVFLPFDRGHNNGAGNPPIPGKVPSAYFWEEILDPDTWLHILTKFIYINHQRQTDPTTGRVTESTQIRFPRYHQWRAVTQLTAAAKAHGPGRNYLIQHSAGSGKTDSIAWTAHRLASLHTDDGEKVFDNVLVISDRQVLDRQLQDAVDQLTTTTGTFQPITSGSEGSKTDQVLDALAADTPIIGLTLQTFPYALQKVRDEGGRVAGRRFAVIADEAHSSQTGQASAALKELLYTSGEDPDEADGIGADQDALARMAAQVDADDRISFFAFTATPKEKTMELFGQRNPTTGELEPFDLYSMKQAIEEDFILDVLQNYTSFEVAARIASKADTTDSPGQDDEVDVRRGTRAILAKVELHPTNVRSKVHEIIEHYQRVVRPELGGKAKAMVVTASRAAAVQYHRAFQREVELRGLDLQSLVAFSGEVPDPDVEVLHDAPHRTVTEASENPGLLGRDLATVFNQAGQHVLIVANKYQTGFDQPLLVAMYVDKQLSGIAAVQTLSRLNRRAPGKDKTFVLDFVNDPEQIRDAFLEYYEDAHVQTESDPELIADLRTALENQNIFTHSEVDQFWTEWRSSAERTKAIYQSLEPAKERFAHRWQQAIYAQDTAQLDQLAAFRSALTQYPKAYAFFSQILDYGDPFYEKLSAYAGLLTRLLKDFSTDEPDPGAVDISNIVLTHYKLEKIRDEANLGLASEDTPGLQGLTEAGMNRAAEKERAAMNEVIEKVNKYLGDLEASDEYKVGSLKLLTNQIAADPTLQQQYRNNTAVDFVHSPALVEVSEDALWSHETQTDEIVKRLREMPDQDRIQLLVDVGLLDALEQAQ